VLAHAMFALPLIQSSTHGRTGAAQWLAEFVATFGLLLVVLGHRRSRDAAWMVAAWIGAAYWFTVRKSGHYHCSLANEHVLRHSAARRAWVYRSTACGGSHGFGRLARFVCGATLGAGSNGGCSGAA
jgi:hypothetical protein